MTETQKVHGDVSVMKVVIENPSDAKKVLFHNRNIGKFSVVRQAAAAAVAVAVAEHAVDDLTKVSLQNTLKMTQQQEGGEEINCTNERDEQQQQQQQRATTVESTIRNATPLLGNDVMVNSGQEVRPGCSSFCFVSTWKIFLLLLLASFCTRSCLGNVHVVANKRTCVAGWQRRDYVTHCCEAVVTVESCVSNFWGQLVVMRKTNSRSVTSS